MDLTGRLNGVLKNAALWAALGVAGLAVALAGLGFLVAGFYVWLTSRFEPAAAAAITGGALLIVALVLLVLGGAIIAKTRKRRPSILSEFSGTIGLAGRLVGMMIRRDPRKAIIVSAVAGALAEYLTSERKK